MRDVAIIGAGQTKVGGHWDISLRHLALEALQAAMTDAMFDWIADDAKVHPNCLDNSLAETNTVLGLYASAIQGTPVELPYQPDGSLLEGLDSRPN